MNYNDEIIGFFNTTLSGWDVTGYHLKSLLIIIFGHNFGHNLAEEILTCTSNWCTLLYMKYDWNPDKNDWLKKNRNISFEQIIFHLGQGDIWRTADHPNQEKYPTQRIYFVIVENYVYLVPHIIKKDFIFLKTIIPSRKATKDFLKEQEK